MGAVPKRRISKSRRGNRRAHQSLSAIHLVSCPECGEPVYLTVPNATPATRIAIMDAVRKIAGIKPEADHRSNHDAPVIVTALGAHPGHFQRGMHVVDEVQDEGRATIGG